MKTAPQHLPMLAWFDGAVAAGALTVIAVWAGARSGRWHQAQRRHRK